MYIHTHIVCFEGKKYVLRGKKRPKKIRPPAAGETPDPCQPRREGSYHTPQDTIHLQTPYTEACRGPPPAP